MGFLGQLLSAIIRLLSDEKTNALFVQGALSGSNSTKKRPKQRKQMAPKGTQCLHTEDFDNTRVPLISRHTHMDRVEES